ncbi:MAG: hypothetical protein RLZZ610_910 [Actinomycetota bacterium]|jgi:subtilisin family serine protease
MSKITKNLLSKTAALLITSALVLSAVPANAVSWSAKPDDKTNGASAGKSNSTKDSSSASVSGAAKPDNAKPENSNSSGQASATKEEKAQSKADKAANAQASGKLTGKERAASAQARRDAKLPTSNYIIVFKADADLDEEVRGIGNLKATVGKRFENAFKGVTVRLNEKQLAGLSNNPNISIIEKDSRVALIEPLPVSSQANAPWGLDRIDQLTGQNTTYNFTVSGSGVTAYVIDTGVLSTHSDFGGRVAQGFSAITGGTEDCNGHGTHVAGTIGSSTYGVAKSVQIVPVRVLDCNGSGTISGVIAGVDWVASQSAAGLKVANMSLGGGASSALDAAVSGLISKGVTVVVAAGNNSANACNYSPARVPAAITVAASTSSDALASYSNTGSCVDIIAPGSAILSTWHTSTSATNTISGTSMAAPHVAGAVALFLQQFGFKSPSEMAQLVKAKGTKSAVSGIGTGTVNLLLHTDPENKIPFTATEEVVTSPTSPTKTTKKPRRANR